MIKKEVEIFANKEAEFMSMSVSLFKNHFKKSAIQHPPVHARRFALAVTSPLTCISTLITFAFDFCLSIARFSETSAIAAVLVKTFDERFNCDITDIFYRITHLLLFSI